MRRMRTLLLTAAVAVLATAAVPSMASAAGWDFDIKTGALPLKFTINGGETKITQVGGGGTIVCQKTQGGGEYKTTTEGTLDFTYTGCKKNGSEECHSAGAAVEEVTSTTVTFHNIMIDSTVQTTNGKAGILITGNNNHFATAVCAKAWTIELIGNGFIGELVSPTCNNGEWRTLGKIDFSSTAAGEQTYKQVETAGTIFDLTYRSIGNATGSIDSKPNFEFEREFKITCP